MSLWSLELTIVSVELPQRGSVKLDKIMTVLEASEIMGISKKTLYKLIRIGAISGFYPCGKPENQNESKPVRVFRSEVFKYIQENTVKAL